MVSTLHVYLGQDWKTAGAIANRSKREDRFKGKSEEGINEYVANYTNTCNDINATAEQRLKYLHNLFDNEAKRLYRNLIQYHFTPFQETCEKLLAEYNSITRQNRVRKYLESLHINEIIKKKPFN